jgi:Uncharacterized membrane-bound protein conserved in bacteria
LVVGASGVSKVGGGIIGAVVGFVVLAYFYFSRDVWGDLSQLASHWQGLLILTFVFLLFLPFGLGITGVVESSVAGKVKT